MQKKIHYKFTWQNALNLSAALLLVLLTIFTSCTSRNFLKLSKNQGVEKTLNMNKATASVSSCASFLDEAQAVAQNHSKLQVFALFFFVFGLSLLSSFTQKSASPIRVFSPSDQQAPLYILYKKRKILA